MRQVSGLPLHAGPAGPSIYALLASERTRGEEPAAIDTSLPDRSDPWFVSYLAVLGTVPDEVSGWSLQRAGLNPSLDLAELLTVEENPIAEPGAVDLIGRVAARRDARFLTLLGLGVHSAAWSQDLATQPTWDSRGWTAAFCGSNIVVVYEPGSVADLCLLWNLRAAHGHNLGLPLGVPNTADVDAVLRAWSDKDGQSWALTLRGFNRPFALTSLSVPQEGLAEIAEAVGPPWEAIPRRETLTDTGSPRNPVISHRHIRRRCSRNRRLGRDHPESSPSPQARRRPGSSCPSERQQSAAPTATRPAAGKQSARCELARGRLRDPASGDRFQCAGAMAARD